MPHRTRLWILIFVWYEPHSHEATKSKTPAGCGDISSSLFSTESLISDNEDTQTENNTWCLWGNANLCKQA